MFVWVEAAADGGDEASGLDGLAVLDAAEEDGVEAVLLVERGDLTGGEWLDDGDAATEEAALVEDVDHPVGKGAEEVAFAELDDAFGKRRGAGAECGAIESRHGGYVAEPAKRGKGLAYGAVVV